jgi:hypothetical protein
MLFLLNRLLGGRYAPVLRASLGVVLLTAGLVESWKIVILAGGAFIVWGLGSGIGLLAGRRRLLRGSRGGSPGSMNGDERSRLGR